MSYVAAVGLVVSTAATAYGAYSQNKAKKEAAARAQGATTKGLEFGEKPKAAEYMPVDFSKEQWDTIEANLNNLRGGGRDLLAETNGTIDADALKRAVKFIPNYQQNMRLEGEASNSLLSGRLPYDDALDIVANRGSLTDAIGTPGTAAPATLRDLGLSRLDAIKSGAGLMQGMVNIAEQVNPVSRRMRPQDMYVNPTDRIRLRMEQNQLIQQSDQSRNNIEAGLPPSDSAATQLALAQRLGVIGGGPVGGSDNSGYAQAAASLISGLGGLYGGSTAGSLNTAGAGARGNYGSSYVGSFGQTPVYRPERVSIPA